MESLVCKMILGQIPSRLHCSEGGGALLIMKSVFTSAGTESVVPSEQGRLNGSVAHNVLLSSPPTL